MPLNCTVKSRRNTTRDLTKKQGISYHRFPCNPTRLETWRGLLQPREQNIKQRRICSAHFTSKDFVTTKCGKVSVTESQRISNTQSSSAADTELMDVDERERTKMSYNSNAGMRGKCVSAAGIPSNVAVAGGRLVLVLFTLCCVECVRAGGRVGRGGGMSSGGASDAGGAEETEGGQELFTQDGVLLKSCIGRPLSELHTTGALCIVEYPNNTKLIEWRPNDLITIDSEIQDQEWAVVNTVGRRSRTLSGNYTQSDLQARARVIRLPLSELKGFRVTRNNQQIQFTNKQSQWHSTFFFQHGNAEIFIHQLKYHLKTAKSRHDRSMYVVVEPNEDVQKMDRSFAELDIFTENTTDVVWNLVSNFKQRPYATTLEAFSKLTDIVYYGNEATNGKRDVSEDVADLLTKSMSALEDTTTATRQDEYEVISVKPTLPPRPCIPRGTPLTPDQWEGLQDTNGRIDEIDGVKHIIFRGGVAHSIRPIVWKYLLDYYPWRMSHSERIGYQKKKIEEYFSMKLQWRSMTPAQETRFSEYHDRKSLVEKDVNRTDRTNPFYAGDHNPNLVILSDILMTYVMYNFDLGYVQGMSDILSPILALLGNEVDSFWCFVGFMDKIASNFDMDQAGMKNQLLQLNQLLMFTSPELAQHLAQKDSGNMYFCFRWLLVWFKREFSQIDIMRLWEVLWTGLPCVNFHLLICVAILDMEKDVLMGNDCGFTEILKHINDLSMSLDVDTILSKAEGIFHQISAASHLTDQIRITLGMEPQGAAPRDDSDSDAPTSSQRNGYSRI